MLVVSLAWMHPIGPADLRHLVIASEWPT